MDKEKFHGRMETIMKEYGIKENRHKKAIFIHQVKKKKDYQIILCQLTLFNHQIIKNNKA